MLRYILLALTIILGCKPLSANTVTALTCLSTDVQTALNTAVDGDTVQIPAGACTWASTVSIPAKAITVLGAGSQVIVGGNDITVISDGVSHSPTDNPTLSVSTTLNKSIRISGITFKNGTGNPGSFNGALRMSGTTTSLRVDHCHFQIGPIMVDVGGPIGVFDHNLVDSGTSPGSVTNWVRMEQSSWQGVGTFGDNSWATPSNLGSGNSLYLEDNIINGGFVNDCINGGRYVIRHNTINNGVIQEHSTGSGQRHRGCRAWEDYQNAFVCGTGCTANGSGAVNFDAHFMTAGTGVIWGDTASQGFTNFATLRNNRSNNQTYTQSPTPSGWGYCGTAFNGTGSNWDQNLVAANGYACLDQIGRGVGDLMAGDFPPFGPGATNTTTGTVAWLHQALEPIYEWLNTWTAVPNNPGQFWSVAGGAVIGSNRDFYNYTPSFNGSTGVGSGVLANRPATCTQGVAYWATDQGSWNTSGSGGQGQLYICSSLNTWTLYYVPYTYPNPLIAGGPIPPSPPPLGISGSGLFTGSGAIKNP